MKKGLDDVNQKVEEVK